MEGKDEGAEKALRGGEREHPRPLIFAPLENDTGKIDADKAGHRRKGVKEA